jgi:signal transduction histidine kinase
MLSITKLTLSKSLLFFLILILNHQILFAKINLLNNENRETGIPFIKNYTPEEYDAHGQNWAIIQDKSGYMYFGNTDGYILQFDGVSWRSIPISNGSIVRSFAMDSSGTIYVGGQNEFGYLSSDSIGILHYNSLMHTIDESYHNFGNVWQIHATLEYIYFSARKYLFRINNSGSIKVWESNTTFQSSFLLPGEQLFIHQMETGLMQLKNDSLHLIPGGELFNNDWIYAVVPAINNKLIIGARKTGLFLFDGEKIVKYDTPANNWLKKNQIYHGVTLQDSSQAFSTLRGGVIILEKNGGVVTIINEEDGLLNDNVWFVYEDRNGSLWLALNKGLAHVQYPNVFSIFNERAGLEGNVQDIVRHDGLLYAATGMGVYKLISANNSTSQAHFELLPGLKSQCWSLLSLPDALLVSCNHGVFKIEKNKFHLITKKSSWQLLRSKIDSNRIFLGLDDGLSSLYKTENGWRDEGKLPKFNAEARTIAEDKLGRLWIGTVYKGVYRVDFENTADRKHIINHFDKRSGLPSMMYNLVFTNGDDVIFGTTHGIYEFSSNDERFRAITFQGEIKNYLNDTTSYKMLAVDGDKNLWFNCNDKPVFARYKSNSYDLQIKRFLNIPKASIYTFYPEQDGVVWIGGTKGIVKYNSALKSVNNQNFQTLIRRVIVKGDSIIFGGTKLVDFKDTILSYSNNALRFEFAATSYITPSMNRYQYMLDGFDESWPTWTSETKKDYTNIPEGEYVFRVRAKDVYENCSSEALFNFKILPPWYRTIWAYFGYFLFVSLSLYFFTKLLINRAKQRAIIERKKIEAIEKIAEEKLRSRVAADFHDELGNRITKISLFSEIIKNNFRENSGKVLEYLDKINENANNLYNETRDFIWHLDPKKDTLLDLIMRLKTFGDELFDGTDIIYKVSSITKDLKNIRLSMDWRQHILRIFKEGLHNSLKYSECSNVKLSIKINEDKVVLKLKDDGKGFEPSEKMEGNGLVNMKIRARAIQAELDILSKPGSGTTIILVLSHPKPDKPEISNHKYQI